MKHSMLAMGLAIGLIAASTDATVTVTFAPASGSTSYTVTPLGGGEFDVTLNTTNAAASTAFTVRGASTDFIRSLTINANTPQLVFVNVHGATDTQTIQSIHSVSSAGSSALVLLNKVRVSQFVDSFRVNSLLDVDVGGDINDSIEWSL
ncbi:hypothetical protein PHYC_03702 [Phycisphaerales bacterium]|nr:hypothetical protein PHYC_03702 [Phycisphaerales bacterium]